MVKLKFRLQTSRALQIRFLQYFRNSQVSAREFPGSATNTFCSFLQVRIATHPLEALIVSYSTASPNHYNDSPL